MRYYKVSIEVSEQQLASVIQVLSRDGRNLTVVEVSAPAANGRRLRVDPPRAPVPKGTPGLQEIALDALKDRPLSSQDVGNALESWGWAASSASPTLTELTRAGKVRRIGTNRYALINKLTPLSEA